MRTLVTILVMAVVLFPLAVPLFAQVDTAWVRRYNGPGDFADYGRAITVDNDCNVYVTGSSAQSGSYPNNYDCATIKYDSDGDTVWIRRYNGLDNCDDGAGAIAIDSSGNVLVTGWCDREGYPPTETPPGLRRTTGRETATTRHGP
jgi:hypothetical protein